MEVSTMEKEKLEFQLSDIPDYVRVNLAIASLDLVQQILRQPDGREMLDRETRRRKLEKSKDKKFDRAATEASESEAIQR